MSNHSSDADKQKSKRLKDGGANESDTLHLGDIAPANGEHQPSPEPMPPGKQPTAAGSMKAKQGQSAKLDDLDKFRKANEGQPLTTNQGAQIADDQNSLKAGKRGPTLLEDFIMREKITHFDHERIPERIVHARGSAAHGYFEAYDDLSDITKAGFLSKKGQKTPVYVRFSTVQGSRGSADTVRDIRGFATKFYTDAGIFDLVGNNTPIFFIQDALKFPDLVHAVKPEPHNDVPQGASAHDTFWDYVSLQPETLHNVIWAMSDRGIPRSFRNMEGFGIHTFRFVNAEGKSTFVRFHWKPVAGTASLLWDEAQKLAGRDPDFHRKDLWQSIEAGDFPEFELGVQLVPEKDEFKFDFDLLDPTKLIPEQLVPVKRVGKMVLNRNPDNFFAETEQVAFHPGHVVPGIDFSNDPLLQGRLFSYTDTQISRLGGPNFHEIPINRPTCPFHNNQRDGMHRMEVNSEPTAYGPNSISDNWPRETQVLPDADGFESYPERIDAEKIRERSDSFQEYYSHPRLFWNSQTKFEQQHIIEAFSFELGMVGREYIRQRIVDKLARIDSELAQGVADNLGLTLAENNAEDDDNVTPASPVNGLTSDSTLSLYADSECAVKGRIVAVLISDGVNADDVLNALEALHKEGIHTKLLANSLGPVTASDGSSIPVDATLQAAPSVTVDAVWVPGKQDQSLTNSGMLKHYLLEAYKHLKVIVLNGDSKGLQRLWQTNANEPSEAGVLLQDEVDKALAKKFVDQLKQHRVWAREESAKRIPA